MGKTYPISVLPSFLALKSKNLSKVAQASNFISKAGSVVLLWDGSTGSEFIGSTVLGAFASILPGYVLNIACNLHGAKLPCNITSNNFGFGPK